MKHIKYHLKTKVNTAPLGEAPIWEDAQGAECTLPYSEDNLKLARSEAYGAVEVVDSGHVLTREEVIAQMSAACAEAIISGVDVELDGETFHFSLSIEDQINLMSLQSMVAAGAEAVPYHADGEECRYYTTEDFNKIVQAATAWKLYQESYFNSLRAYIRSMETQELQTVSYGMDIPEEYRTEVLRQISGGACT